MEIFQRKKREASLLGISLFKSLRMLVGMLFGCTALLVLREGIMLEISLQSIGEIKRKSFFWWEEVKKLIS